MKLRFLQISSNVILIFGVALMVFPLWMIFASSTHTSSLINADGIQFFLGDNFFENYHRVFNKKSGFSKNITVSKIFLNSFIMAIGIASVSVVTSLMAAYTIIYFRTKYATLLFWMIFITLLLPLELRVFPSYSIVSDLNLLNSYAGLILPISASAISTFFFQQFYKSVPDELLEAAKLDGTTSWRFFVDFLVPLSKTMITAVFIFMFVYGYNQYLWPIIVTSEEEYWTVVMGLKMLSGGIVDRFSYIMLSLVPPIIIVVFLQRWFVQGIFQNK